MQLNDALIPASAPGSSQARVYTWLDDTVLSGVTYWYMLVTCCAQRRDDDDMSRVEVTAAAPTQ